MQDSWQDHSSISELKPSFPHSTSSSAVVSLSDAACQETNSSSQTSDQSGSVLKEHDYIGLAEVSSASVILGLPGNAAAAGKPPAGALTMEETDLRLGLGPLMEPAVPPKMAPRAEDIHSSLELKKGEFKEAKDVDARKEVVIWPDRPQAFRSGAQEMPIQEKQMADSRRQPAYGLQQRNGGQDAKYAFMDGPSEQRSAQGAWQAATLRGMACTPATNGVKRGYSEAMAESSSRSGANAGTTVKMNGGQQAPESEAKAVPKHQQSAFLPNWAPGAAAKTTSGPAWHVGLEHKPAAMAAPRAEKSHEDNQDAACNDAPFPKGQVVGWPPIRAYRKNTLAAHFVKVNMDGVQWGRKVDLNAHSCYEGLLSTLEEMFQCSTATPGASQTQSIPRDNHINDAKPFRLLNGSEFVLTYEDKEEDWMLVGDVPWGLFVNAVRRLRIMRGSEATGLGPEKPKCHA